MSTNKNLCKMVHFRLSKYNKFRISKNLVKYFARNSEINKNNPNFMFYIIIDIFNYPITKMEDIVLKIVIDHDFYIPFEEDIIELPEIVYNYFNDTVNPEERLCVVQLRKDDK